MSEATREFDPEFVKHPKEKLQESLDFYAAHPSSAVSRLSTEARALEVLDAYHDGYYLIGDLKRADAVARYRLELRRMFLDLQREGWRMQRMLNALRRDGFDVRRYERLVADM